MSKSKIISTKTPYQNKYLTLIEDLIQYSNGDQDIYSYIVKKPSVLIIPYDPSTDTFYLVKQYRHPHQKEFIEFPAGGIEKNETPKQAALRELEEETSLTTNSLFPLGFFHSDIGTRKSITHLFLALSPTPSPHPHLQNKHEKTQLLKISHSNLKDYFKTGKVNETWALSAYTLFLLKYPDFSQYV